MRQPGYLNPKIKEVLIYVVIILIPTILGVVLSLVFNKWMNQWSELTHRFVNDHI